MRVDTENYNVLKLTPLTKPLLRDGQTLVLAKPRVKPVKTRRARKENAEIGADKGLLDRLKTWRRETADEQGVPAFMVFSDVTLIQMATKKPRNRKELLEVSGVGEHKAARYGEAVLKVLN